MAANPLYPGTGLEIGFLGLPLVFNDGKAENTLTIALTNNNFFGTLEPAQDSTIVFNQDTPISLWFVVDVTQASAGAERYWALTSYDALHEAKVALTASPGDWDIRRSDDLSGSPLYDSLNGWELTAREDVVLSPGQSLLLTLSGLTTDLPDGPAFGYVQVVMPHLDTNNNVARSLTKTIGPITKSRVMLTGERMGIGTGTPNSTLEVNGAVRARGGDPGEDGDNNNGFFFDGVGDVDSGMTSLEDGDLTFYINDQHALRLQKPLGDGSKGPNNRAVLRGNLLIQAYSPVELFVDGEAFFSGNIKSQGDIDVDGDARFNGDINSQGRVQDQSGILMPVGAIIAYGGERPPPGWLLCDGAAVPSGAEYNDLRDIIGDSVPNLKGRFIMGAGNNYYFGRTDGEETVTLTAAQMPAHRHGYYYAGNRDQNEGWIDNDDEKQQWYIKMSDREGGNIDPNYSPEMERDIRAQSIKEAGGNESHNNLPPYYALTYIIKY